MTMVVWGALLAGLIGLNSYASLLCMRSTIAEPSQKLYQLILVWVMPLLGAAIAIHVAREATRDDAAREAWFESGAGDDDWGDHWTSDVHGGGHHDAADGDGSN